MREFLYLAASVMIGTIAGTILAAILCSFGMPEQYARGVYGGTIGFCSFYGGRLYAKRQ